MAVSRLAVEPFLSSVLSGVTCLRRRASRRRKRTDCLQVTQALSGGRRGRASAGTIFPVCRQFPIWSEQASGIVQFAVWTALAEAGISASLQDYNPVVDDAVTKTGVCLRPGSCARKCLQVDHGAPCKLLVYDGFLFKRRFIGAEEILLIGRCPNARSTPSRCARRSCGLARWTDRSST